MKEVPRRLLVLGGGPVGTEMAQAVRRLGGEVALVGGALLEREPAPLGRGARRGAAPRRHRAPPRRARDRRPPRRRGLRAGARRRQRTAWRPAAGRHRPAPASARHRPRDGGHRAGSARRAGRRAAPRRRAAVGDRRRHRHLPADARRQVPGPRRRLQPDRHAARGELRRGAARHLHRPGGRGGRRHRGALQRDRARRRGGEDRDVHARVRRPQRLPHPAQRRRAADRRLRARPGGGGVAPAGHAGHPRPRPARRLARHHPTLPDLLGDLPQRAQGAQRRDRRRPEPVAA